MTPQAVAAALRRHGLQPEIEEAPERGRLRRDGDAEPALPRPVGLRCEVSADELPAVLRSARDELGFSLLSSLTATDEGDHLQLLYHLVRPGDPELPGFLLLVVRAVRGDHPDGPLVPSAVAVYPGANLQEREVFDLMGVRFRGHPALTRVLTWPGFRGHPLRKDYEQIDEEIPWRLAGLRGPDGGLLTEEEARAADQDAAAWEVIAGDATLAAPPRPVEEQS
jgi:NADH:ubiquinone oxidoreductase subunit C